MKKFLCSFATVALLALPLAGMTGCETSHTESTKQGLFGGTKHTEDTTYKNPVTGDVSSEHQEVKTNP